VLHWSQPGSPGFDYHQQHRLDTQHVTIPCCRATQKAAAGLSTDVKFHQQLQLYHFATKVETAITLDRQGWAQCNVCLVGPGERACSSPRVEEEEDAHKKMTNKKKNAMTTSKLDTLQQAACHVT
jgi:hypothetical protein